MPATPDFPACEPGNIIEPVNLAVISEPVDHHQARLLRRNFPQQNIVAPHIDAEDDQVIEQVLPQFFEVRHEFRQRVTLLEIPPQGPGFTAIIIRDQIDDKTFPQIGFQLAVILWNMLEVSHPAPCQILVQDEFASGLRVALAFLDFDYLMGIFRMQVADALLAYPDRFAGNLQHLLIHRAEKDITNRRSWLYPFVAL